MTRPDPVRADVALVERGIVRSRALAQRLIASGAVDLLARGEQTTVARCAQPVFPDQELMVRPSPEARFASRGGGKLEPGLSRAGIDCRGVRALDVGMSTGGFTDCLLQRGACEVVGIEVGHGQLDERVAADARVRCFEKTHVRDVTPLWFAGRGIDAAAFGLFVVDLSFISTVGLLDHLAGMAAPGTMMLVLIKPQFELGPDALNGRGIVKAGTDIDALHRMACARARNAGWQPLDWFACGLQGTDGNQEYFLVLKRQPVQSTQPAA